MTAFVDDGVPNRYWHLENRLSSIRILALEESRSLIISTNLNPTCFQSSVA
jgi:hypothetical protein